MTTRRTLRFTARFFYSGPASLLEERVAETLDMVGLTDKADRPIRAFSGGRRQRLGIAQAQVNQPDLLILDEPAAALDPRGRHDVLAILERLTGSLCDAVTGQQGGGARLEALERGNFFVVPLDERRVRYRYHHLFAQVLHAHLLAEQPELVPLLHRRAGEWYEQQGAPAEAIRHALAAADFERAARLVEPALRETRRSRREGLLLGWFKALPGDLYRNRPVRSAHYAEALLAPRQLDDVTARLQDAERWLDETGPSPEMSARPGAAATELVVVDQDAFRALHGSIVIWRAGLPLMQGDVPASVLYARRALDLVPAGDDLGRGGAEALLGLAYWSSGALDAALRTYADGMARVQKAGFIPDVINGAIAVAEILIAQGRLRDAMRAYEQALQLAREQGDPALRGTADVYLGLSDVEREQDNLVAAAGHQQKSKEQGEHTGFPQYPYHWRVAMARLRQAQGYPDGALELLGPAERLLVSDFYPDVGPLAAMKTRIWLVQGRLGDAPGWVSERGLSRADELSYLREFEHITLARVLLACYKSDGAVSLLQQALDFPGRLLQAAEAGGRAGNAIEILVLQALAYQLHGDHAAAMLALERAIVLPEPEGYVRVFIDEGSAMTMLLERAHEQGLAPLYVRKLLAAPGTPADTTPADAAPAQDVLVEPLSERELAVLRLLGGT